MFVARFESTGGRITRVPGRCSHLRFYRIPRGLRSFPQLVQKMEQRNPHHGVQQAQDQRPLNFERQLLSQQRPRHQPIEELMKEEEEERQQHPDQGVVHIQAQAHRGREIAHQGVHNAEHAERVLGKRILRQPHQGAHRQAGDLAAPHQREVHRHQQRHLQKAQELEEQRNVHLEENGAQRHHHHDPGGEPRDLAFALATEQNVPAGVTHGWDAPPGGGAALDGGGAAPEPAGAPAGPGFKLKSGGFEPGTPSPNLWPCAAPMSWYWVRSLSASVPAGAPGGPFRGLSGAFPASAGGGDPMKTGWFAGGESGIGWCTPSTRIRTSSRPLAMPLGSTRISLNGCAPRTTFTTPTGNPRGKMRSSPEVYSHSPGSTFSSKGT